MAKKQHAVGEKAAQAGASPSPVPAGEQYIPFLKNHYTKAVVPALQEKFKFANKMMLPRISKVTLNMGVGEGTRDIKVLEAAEADLMAIAGQKPRRTTARMSIAAFKVREGMPVGCSVTLRGNRMWEFLHRLIFVALPRVRDFRGIPPKAFDGRGNYSMGIKEHSIFTEIDLAKVAKNLGMNVTICTTARNDEEAFELLKELGMPFRK